MDNKSTACFAWFVLLKEAANKLWERLRETLRHAFNRKTRYLEDKEPRSLGKDTRYSKLVRSNKPRISLKDGYTPYLPSPAVLTPSDFSIWSAFFPYSTDVVLATPVKPVKSKTQADFSIWCAFFQESANVVCATQAEHVMLKTQASASIRSYTMHPKLLPAVTVSLGVMSPSAPVAVSPVCRTQRPSLIAPSASLLCCSMSLHEVATTSSVIPFSRHVTPRSVFTCPLSPSVADFRGPVSSLRSVFTYRLVANTPTHMSAARTMFPSAMSPLIAGSSVHVLAAVFVYPSSLWPDRQTVMNEPQAVMPEARRMSISVARYSIMESPMQVFSAMPFFASVATVLSPMNIKSLYQVISTASGFASVMSPSVSETSPLISTTDPNFIWWQKVIQILSLLSKARHLMFSVKQSSMTWSIVMYVTSVVPSTVVPYAELPHALSSAVGPMSTVLMSPANIASQIVESSLNWPKETTSKVLECPSESTLSPESLTSISLHRQMVLISLAYGISGASVYQPVHRMAIPLRYRLIPLCSSQTPSPLSLSETQIQNLQLLQSQTQWRMIAGSGERAQQTGILSMFPTNASRVYDGFLPGSSLALRAKEYRLPSASVVNGSVPGISNLERQLVAVTVSKGKSIHIAPACTSQDYVAFGHDNMIDVSSENAITCEDRFIHILRDNIVSVTSSSQGVQRERKSTLSSSADDDGLPMFSTSEDSVTTDVQEHGAAVTACGTSIVPTSTTEADDDPQVHTDDDDNFMSTFLGFSQGADFREGVVECREDFLPETSVGQRLRAAARLQRKQEGYDNETFQIFRQNENKYRADPCYMDRQIYISNEMRNTTVSWMAEIADYVEMSHTSLFLSVNFFDRFMSECNVTKNNLQLVAVTCMFIAGKIEKGDEAAAADDYVYLTASTYISDQIFGLEKLILKKLQFNLFVPTVAWFCKELLDVCNADDILQYMTMFLAEMTMLDVFYISVKPSTIAAASLCLARHNLGLPGWTLELWERSCYLPDDILPCVRSIARTCAFYRATENETQRGILRKYSTEKYQEIAIISKFPEQDIDGLEKKCREFGALEFASPSRSACKRYRYNLFGGRDTPLTYEPNKRRVSCYKSRTKRGVFESYGVETYEIMRGSEYKSRADPDYMNKQIDIHISRRQLEVNWMIHFIGHANYPTSSLLLAVNLMDRFLSHRYVKKEMLKLVAVACLFITTKFEVMCSDTIDVFTTAVRNAYSKEQIIGMERLILNTLDFNLLVPTAAWFGEELLDVCSANDTLRALTRYLVELTTLEIRYLHYLPSQIAAAALCIARYSLGLPPWTKQLLERSGYELEDFLGCLRSMYDDYKLSEDHQGELQCKFRKPKYMEVADFTKYPVPGISRLLELYFKEMDQT